MQISHTYDDFVNGNSLIVVTGTHVAKVYQLKKGKVLKKPTVNIPNPRLTDREGTRRREGRGTVWGTASDYQQKDNNVRVEFGHALKKEFKEILQQQKIDAVYLFAPSRNIQDIKELLPKAEQKKVIFEYTGNFTKFTPDELFGKISTKIKNHQKKEEKLKPKTEKILARKKVKNTSK